MKFSIPVKIGIFIVLVLSLLLGIHNASLYDPTNGFDGSGHIYYINYLNQYHQVPPPTEWETHQPPLYYILAASVSSIFGFFKSVQFINIFVFLMIVAISGLGLTKIFKDKKQVLIGMFSLISLPMLNIFSPAVTNEPLNTFWIISAVVSSIYIYYSKNKKEYLTSFFFLLISLIFGIWTKLSIITVIPTILVSLLLSSKNVKQFLLSAFIAIAVFGLAYTPIYLRTAGSVSPSNIVTTSTNFRHIPPLSFFLRMDWLTKLDMYNAQYYSFIGGGWNSFWTDGQNAITPFVPFHKKSFILWGLGFILLPLSLYGLFRQFKENKKVAIIMTVLGLSMLGFYVFYNIVSNHYSAVRLTYEMGIVLPYAFGLASASENKNVFKILLLLITIQFVTLLSFFWIQPWWFVTKNKFS